MTDGGDTCGGNPSLFLESLGSKGTKLPVILVVGLTKNASSISQLQSIAYKSKGKYYGVENLDELFLDIKRALRN